MFLEVWKKFFLSKFLQKFFFQNLFDSNTRQKYDTSAIGTDTNELQLRRETMTDRGYTNRFHSIAAISLSIF